MTVALFVYLLVSNIIIPALFISILCCLSIYILCGNELNIREMRKYFCLSIIVGSALYTGSYAITLPILSVLTIVWIRNENKQKTIIILIIYSVYFLNAIYIFVYSFCDATISNSSLKYILIEFLIMLIIISVILVFTKKFFKYKLGRDISAAQLRFIMILIIIVPLTICISAISIITFWDIIVNKKIEYVIGNVIPQIIPLTSLIFACVVVYNQDKSSEYRVRLNCEAQEKREIEEYSHVIEDMYAETRRFKHDYMNMLSPLKEYIDNNDMKGLKEFFYNNVIDMDKEIKWSGSNIDKLKHIKFVGLKAILSAKIIKATSMNIDIKVDIIEDIDYVDMKVMDLCRIVGILMDNAIEAAIECEYPKLKVCVVNKNDYVVLVVHNNFFGNKPLIHKIFIEGFSTKGSARGLGLYTVKNIIDTRYDNVFLNTAIEDRMFIQELWVKYEDA
jgi:two-component system sensor histidine kinase AgrC